MSKSSEKEDETLNKLKSLQKLLSHVYLPFLEDRQEIRMHIEKFMKQISNTKQQAYGTVTIEIPEIPNISKEEMSKDQKLLNLLQKTVVSILHYIINLAILLIKYLGTMGTNNRHYYRDGEPKRTRRKYCVRWNWVLEIKICNI